jgi:Predicted Zn-dependent peptidases, insulinase-like
MQKNNFVLKNEIALDCINSTGYLYEHASGAQFIFIKNDDPNKVFSVAFKTLPENNKGTAHILEHCTLCGSKKYPLKDTFNEVASSRLYTYLNAMTFKDKTVYPVASMYENELKYLIDVYMDCVYNPLLNLETFLHEGWHYEKQTSGLDVNGVVYSEMKSAFSNPVRETRSFIHKKLFPDTIYQYEAAGIPKNILEIKHEEIINFHKKFYTASNSFLYLYGDIENIDTYLELFDSYLNSKSKEKFLIKKQKPFSSHIVANALYDFSGAQKKFFGAGFVIGDSSNTELILTMNVLNSYLSKMVGAPLKKFLPLVKTFFENDIYQPVYSILSENFNGSTEKFRDTLLKIFSQVYNNGLNKNLLESCINNLEFEICADSHKYRPKGLVTNLLILTKWIYGFDPFLNIDRIKILNGLREKLSQNYFEDIIKKYILFNEHAAFVSLMPDNKNNFQFTPSPIDIINAQKMKEFIDKKDENQIELADVYSSDFIQFDETEKFTNESPNFIHTKIDTQEIIYLDFLFNTNCIDQNLLPYVGILAETLVFTALQNSSYENMQAIINNIGHIKINSNTYSKDNFDYIPVIDLKIKMLPQNIDNIIELLDKIFSINNFDSKTLIKKLLMQKFSLMNNSFITNPTDSLIKKILSYHSNEYKYKDITSGINFFNFIKTLIKNFDNEYESLIQKLMSLVKSIFTKETCLVHIACDQNNFNLVHPKIKKLTENLPESKNKYNEFDFANYKTNEAFFTTSTVNSNALIIPLDDLEITGAMNVFETFMNKNYLIQEVRINGGAYDCKCKFKNNAVYFYSYADPNIKSSFEKFKNATDFLINYNFSHYDFQKCIVNAINNFDKIEDIESRCQLSLERYMEYTNLEELNFLRSQITLCTIFDIKNIAHQIKNNLDKAMFCTIGSREKVMENKDLFSDVSKLL